MEGHVTERVRQERNVYDQLTGTENFEIEGAKISVSHRTFLPENSSFLEGKEIEKKRASIIMPGFSVSEKAASIEKLSQTFANEAGAPAHVVDTRTENPLGKDFLEKEAKAIVEFIMKNRLEGIDLIGNSQGGELAVEVAYLLQEKYPDIKVRGLILLDAMALYDQSKLGLAKKYVQDLGRTARSMVRLPRMRGRDQVRSQNRKYSLGGMVNILGEVFRSNFRYPERINTEIDTMVRKNPNIAKITAPVVILQGADDLLSHPSKIIHSDKGLLGETYIGQVGDRQYSLEEREKYLKEHLFTSSKAVLMIVAEKLGHHNVMYSRPEQVAKVVSYLLNRLHDDEQSMMRRLRRRGSSSDAAEAA